MKSKAPTPQSVWTEYELGREYKRQIKLYRNYAMNEDFFLGDQWKLCDAPMLPKPVFNIIKRPCTHIISTVATDDISFDIVAPFKENDEAATMLASALKKEIEQVFEEQKVKTLFRELLRNAVVDGDMCLYWYFDADAKTSCRLQGKLVAEICENINVYFSNYHSSEVQNQSSIIIAMRRTVAQVRNEAIRNGMAEDEAEGCIIADDDQYQNEKGSADDILCTELLRFWRDNDGHIRFMKTTRKAVIKPETVTDMKLYPLAWMPWEKVKASMHGRAVVTGIVPNQTYINKQFATMMLSAERNAYPKNVYNVQRIPEWNNHIGEDIKCNGPVDESAFRSIRGGDFSAQMLELTRTIISMTKECIGIPDVAQGNIERPDNVSAILATQRAASTPLNLQKLSFYQFVEDTVLILIDMIFAYCKEQLGFDMADGSQFRTRIEIGSTDQWDEVGQYMTIENLWKLGIIKDAITVVEAIPSSMLRNKEQVVEKLKAELIEESNESLNNESFQARDFLNSAPTTAQPDIPIGERMQYEQNYGRIV